MTNKLLPYIKTFKEQIKEKKEQTLTDDDIIAILDEHLQREITSDKEKPSPKDEKDETEDQRSNDIQVPKNDETEQISGSQIDKKIEELDDYIAEKKKEIDKYVARIKRKDPPSGDVSDKALTNEQKVKANWFEVDV